MKGAAREKKRHRTGRWSERDRGRERSHKSERDIEIQKWRPKRPENETTEERESQRISERKTKTDTHTETEVGERKGRDKQKENEPQKESTERRQRDSKIETNKIREEIKSSHKTCQLRFPERKRTKRGIFLTFQMITITKILSLSILLDRVGTLVPFCLFL